MQCAQCGSANDDTSRFCTTCGKDLAGTVTGTQPDPVPQPGAAQPVYAPPPAGAQPAYAPPGTPPAKKRRGCVIAAVIVAILLLCCCGSAAAAYFGVVSLGKPRDLGVRYTQEDYDSATNKLGIDVSGAGPESPTAKAGAVAAAGGEAAGGTTTEGQEVPETGAAEGGTTGGTSGGTTGGSSGGGAAGQTRAATVESGPAAGTTVIYEGSVPVDVEITNEEFSALISLNHYSQNWLVKDMQVRFGDGNTVETSGYVEYEGQRYPVYVAGTAKLTGPRSFGGSATAVSVAGWSVPAEYYPFAAEFLAGLMNDWLAQMPGLNLESVDIADGMVHIKGTMPARVLRVPADR